MEYLRKVLKFILEKLAQAAIKKHGIDFVVVVGWFGTDLVKEGIYDVLSEQLIVRRNTKRIWWDLSIPLLILGYEDRQRSFLRWIALIFKTMFSLVVNPKNPHKIIVDLNLADKNTAEYWGKIIFPEILVIASYKKEKPFTIEKLVKSTELNEGKIFVAADIAEDKFNKFSKFGYKANKDSKVIFTKVKEYPLAKNTPSFIARNYAPIICVAEYLGWNDNKIQNAILKTESVELLTERIKEGIINHKN